jgi:hypothetical protein
VIPSAAALGDEEARLLSAPERKAMRLYVAAARAEVEGAGPEAVRALVGSAVSLAPDEPNLRFLAGILALRAGALDDGATNLKAALALEGGPQRRALALLWLARAEEARGRRAEADAARRALARIDHPDAEPSRRAALRDRGRKITRRALSTIVPDLLVIDATFLAHER